MPPQSSPENKDERKPIKSLRTFAGDVEEAIAKQKFSASTIALAEQKRREEKPELVKIPEEKSHKNIYIYGSILLFILGIGTVTGVYFWRSNQDKQLVEKPQTLIAYSKNVDIPIAGKNNAALVDEIVSEKKSFNLPINSVLYINYVGDLGKQADISDVLHLLFPNMPPSLERSFEGSYMFGIYSYDTNEPFVILTTNDYALSYSGMLRWEGSIVYDLRKIFSITGNASSTLTFVDKSIKNYDLRVLQDDSRKTQLLYSFINRKTLVITKNENIFSAIVGKYQISKQAK